MTNTNTQTNTIETTTSTIVVETPITISPVSSESLATEYFNKICSDYDLFFLFS